jgi:hypothetical protein
MTNTLGNTGNRRKTKYDVRSAESLKQRVMGAKYLPKKKEKTVEGKVEEKYAGTLFGFDINRLHREELESKGYRNFGNIFPGRVVAVGNEAFTYDEFMEILDAKHKDVKFLDYYDDNENLVPKKVSIYTLDD